MKALSTAVSILTIFVLLPPIIASRRQEEYRDDALQSPLGNFMLNEAASRYPGKIPGDSPFEYCDQNTKDDLFQISYVKVNPTPPQIGDYWDFEMGGKFGDDLLPRSTVHITGAINGTHDLPGLDVIVDFCKLVDSVEQDERSLCPPKKGNTVIKRKEYIPWAYPDATYIFTLDAQTLNGERVFCLYTEVWLENPHR